MIVGRIVIGWPNSAGVSIVSVERNNRSHAIGKVRQAPGDPRRWFPIDASGLPIEGTFRTKKSAAQAVYDAQGGTP